MLLSEAIAKFLLACRADGLAARTVESYAYRLKRLEAGLGNMDLSNVSTDDLRAYAADLYNSDLSIHTIHGYIRALKRLFNWLASEGLLSDNPARRVRLPRLPTTAPKAVSLEDARRLLQAARESGEEWEQKRNVALLLFLLDTGCRLGGVVGLTLDDLDLERRVARVQEKGGQWRFVFLSDTTVKALRTWIEARDRIAVDAGNALWVARGGRALTRYGVQNMLKRLKKRAGIDGPAGAHSFRHRFAISYLTNGGDLASLADLLGHKDIQTTKQYYARFERGELQRLHEMYSPVQQIKD